MAEYEKVPTATSKRHEKAKAKVEQATRGFKGVETISAKEVEGLRNEGKRVMLVDVRTEEEMEVSMLRGALSRDAFESSRLGESAKTGVKFQDSSPSREEENKWDVVVPYCTVGYRSGLYAKKLLDLGYPAVRNSEGVLLWTHDVGAGLVAPSESKMRRDAEGHGDSEAKTTNDAENDPGGGTGSGSPQRADDDSVEVKRVHVYASPWDFAREDYEAVKFSSTGWFPSTFQYLAKFVGRGKK
ncbi:unnamed protein product [Ascophyllum nodosum]